MKQILIIIKSNDQDEDEDEDVDEDEDENHSRLSIVAAIFRCEKNIKDEYRFLRKK